MSNPEIVNKVKQPPGVGGCFAPELIVLLA
jgi:hypothetical protein